MHLIGCQKSQRQCCQISNSAVLVSTCLLHVVVFQGVRVVDLQLETSSRRHSDVHQVMSAGLLQKLGPSLTKNAKIPLTQCFQCKRTTCVHHSNNFRQILSLSCILQQPLYKVNHQVLCVHFSLVLAFKAVHVI